MVIIMRGISGSGKSTWIKENHPNAHVCSADFWFMKDGKYNFDPNKLGFAHNCCLRSFVTALQARYQHTERKGDSIHDVIIVDNTNTTLLEMAPYVQLAKSFGREVKFQVMECDPEVAAERNSHGVDLKTCKRQHNRLKQNMDLPEIWK